ncbi:MAG: hypothetical protein LH478_04360 [Chitinophagaceae bacterium]|nr:hypothetical protein [Chitinophagaceae bacterium]
MFVTKTKTTETFILPQEFDYYTNLGYTIFMSKPTMFGTYKALKIEAIKTAVTNQEPANYKVEKKHISPFSRLLSTLMPG